MEKTIKIFLASSEELAEERRLFEIFIYRKCKEWKWRKVFFELIIWEDHIDVMSKTRLQSEYNKVIKECDIFVMLFWNKVGMYTEEEFETAFHHFQETSRPFILTYFKDVPSAEKQPSLFTFQKKLADLGHFVTVFRNTDWLLSHFISQMEKMYAGNFGVFTRNDKQTEQQADNIYKPINKHLIKDLMNAMQAYNVNARKFMTMPNKPEDWEMVSNIYDTAEIIISGSFVGVLGIQVRKLLAIGKTNYEDTRQAVYITNCLRTLRRALQLLCFTYLSKLWDHKKQNDLAIKNEHAAIISQFFDTQFEPGNESYLKLLESLINIYKEITLEVPIPELINLFTNEALKNEFMEACTGLTEIEKLSEKRELQILSCYEAEKHIATVLRLLAFLANYKMVSIKNIDYAAMRYSPAEYIHNYISIGIFKQNEKPEKVDCVPSPVNTDGILMYTKEYRSNINLFPFIIDMNALTLEGGSNIYMYSCREVNDDSLNYTCLQDNSVKNIAFTNTGNSANKNELMLDVEKRKLLKLDRAYSLFLEARDTILRQNQISLQGCAE